MTIEAASSHHKTGWISFHNICAGVYWKDPIFPYLNEKGCHHWWAGHLRLRPCHYGDNALLGTHGCMNVNWNKGQMKIDDWWQVKQGQEWYAFYRSWNDTKLSVSLAAPKLPTEKYRRSFWSQALTWWFHVGNGLESPYHFMERKLHLTFSSAVRPSSINGWLYTFF